MEVSWTTIIPITISICTVIIVFLGMKNKANKTYVESLEARLLEVEKIYKNLKERHRLLSKQNKRTLNKLDDLWKENMVLLKRIDEEGAENE